MEDPEELDTRFSRFSPSVTEDTGSDELDSVYGDDGSSEILDLFRQIQADKGENDADGASARTSDDSPREHTRIFLMNSLQQVIEVSSIIAESYHGFSSLYKAGRFGENGGKYLLLLTQGEEENNVFDRTCNIVSEYGIPQRTVPGSSAFLAEHYESLIRDNAVHALGTAASQAADSR